MCYDNYLELSKAGISVPAQNGRYRLRKGFTLVEILIVVVIISIAALVAVPMFSSAGSMQIRSAANIIAADLEYAKSMAITTGQNYSVVFDTNNETYKVVVVNQNGEDKDIVHPVTKKTKYEVNFKNDSRLNRVDIVSAFGTSNRVTFDYMGSPVEGGSIVICSDDGAKADIIVTPVTGYISIN